MARTILTSACALVMLGACASSPAPETAPSTDSVPQAGLPAQNLAYGECGLFLWSVSGEPKFTFFSQAGTGTAQLLIGEDARPLSQSNAGGNIFGQFTTLMSYTSQETGHTIDVSLVAGDGLEDGQRVPTGRISLTDIEGWETVIPVSGVRACRERPAAAP